MAKVKRTADPNSVLAVRLREYMEKRGKKQKELAEYLGGIPENTISYFCSGKRMPNTSQLKKISQFLNVSVDYLLGIPLSVQQETIADIQNTINVCIEHYKSANEVALIYLQEIEQLTHQLETAETTTDDESGDEYAGVNRDFSGGRYDGA